MIYLNAAGHGLPDSRVRSRMIRHLQREEEIGPVQAEAEAAAEAAAVRTRLAAMIGASEAEIALPAWTTTGWNAAVLSLPLAGRRVLAAPGEWSSNVVLLQRLGARFEVMPVGPDGTLDVQALASRIDDDLGAICAPLVCSLTGERYPLEAIGGLDRPEHVPFIVDAAQALGQTSVSVSALNADILAAPLRKWLRSPRGAGMLYVRQRWLNRMEPSLVADYGGAPFSEGSFTDRPDARRFEPMGFFAAQRLGVAAALDVFDDIGAESVFSAIRALASHVRERASASGIDVAGTEPEGSGIVTLRMPQDRLTAAMAALTAARIVVKDPGPDCEPLRAAETVTRGFLRISPHVYNTTEEIDRLFDVLQGA